MYKKLTFLVMVLLAFFCPFTVQAADFGGTTPDQQPCIANLHLNQDFNEKKIESLFGTPGDSISQTSSGGMPCIWHSYKDATVATANGKIKAIGIMRKFDEKHNLLQTQRGITVGVKSDEVLRAYGLPTMIDRKKAGKLDVTTYFYNSIGKVIGFSIFDGENTVFCIEFFSDDFWGK